LEVTRGGAGLFVGSGFGERTGNPALIFFDVVGRILQRSTIRKKRLRGERTDLPVLP
jgi:hypothetical protein